VSIGMGLIGSDTLCDVFRYMLDVLFIISRYIDVLVLCDFIVTS